MLVLVWLAAVALVGCSYSSPELSEERFRCDDRHACQSDRKCVDGYCESALVGQVGPACGERTCGADMQCCYDAVNPLRCVSLSTTCARTLECDGAEDCEANERCCTDGASTECVGGTTCASQYVCSSAAQCPGATPNCCLEPLGLYKYCQATPC